MPTLAEYRQEMLRIASEDLGEYHDIDSLTTTTVVVNDLATGFFSDQKLHGYFILRPDAASAADRIRVVDDFNSSNGTLTHDGTNYSDTMATDEVVELWKYNPKLVDEAINTTLKRMRRMYGVEIPVHGNMRRYWLHDLGWVEEPADVDRIDWFNSPQLSRDRYFEQYNTYDTGTLQPDFWAISGSGASMARSTTQTWKNKYTLAITRSGSNATVAQGVGLLETGVDDDTLRGEDITAVLVGYSANSNSLRVEVDDGATQSQSDYHTGGGSFEELTVVHTVSGDATKLDLNILLEVDETAYAGECYLMFTGSLTDAMRRDSYERRRVYHKGYDQTASLPVYLEPRGTGGYYLVTTQRSYPQFTQSRIRAGTADADVSDAPLEIVATGAIGRLYERMSQVENDRNRLESSLAVRWNKRFEEMAKRHLYRWNTEHGAAPTFGRTWAAPARTRRW